jgi:anti-sigma B factor antagonist
MSNGLSGEVRDGGAAPPYLQRFEAESRSEQGNTVLIVRGEIDVATAPQVQEPLTAAVERGEPVVIDLGECGFIDSTGIAMLVHADRRLRGPAGEPGIVLCELTGQVRRLLEVAGLTGTIAVFESRDEALSEARSA